MPVVAELYHATHILRGDGPTQVQVPVQIESPFLFFGEHRRLSASVGRAGTPTIPHGSAVDNAQAERDGAGNRVTNAPPTR
jgi:hypothetical protein